MAVRGPLTPKNATSTMATPSHTDSHVRTRSPSPRVKTGNTRASNAEGVSPIPYRVKKPSLPSIA